MIRASGAGVVRAAQAGDRAALDELAATHLPMVYAIVRQSLDGHPDVDDVTQDIMVRALRQLGSLRSPESFRPWLAAIALRQVSTHQDRTGRDAAHVVPLDDVPDVADAGARFEGVTGLRAELSVQRRQARRAARWLDPDDRILLALWWLETAGRLSRAGLAKALGVTVVHAGVRVQRMRAHLELSRMIVAALDARPRCRELDAELAGWDGVPGPRWRKRLGRHVRACVTCGAAAGGLVEPDRLLPVVLAVPAAVTRSAAHPVAAVLVASALVVGVTAGAVHLAGPDYARPVTVALTPEPATTSSLRGPGPLRIGPVSLEAANATGRYVTAAATFGVLTAVGPDNTVTARRQSSFQVVTGLADARCFSFRYSDGGYLRHASWRVRVTADEGTPLFRGDATFCPGPGTAPGSVSLESSNYPGWFLRHRGDELWVDRFDGTESARADGSFLVRAALARI